MLNMWQCPCRDWQVLKPTHSLTQPAGQLVPCGWLNATHRLSATISPSLYDIIPLLVIHWWHNGRHYMWLIRVENPPTHWHSQPGVMRINATYRLSATILPSLYDNTAISHTLKASGSFIRRISANMMLKFHGFTLSCWFGGQPFY